MATRSHIEIMNKEGTDRVALIYRHWDGYPGREDGTECGVLPDIVPFIRSFVEERGYYDDEYLAARLLQHLTNKHSGTPTGYGICQDYHSDIDYLYRIYPDRVDVYEYSDKKKRSVDLVFSFGSFSKYVFKKIQSVKL